MHQPIEIKVRERVPEFEDPGTLISRLNDREFLNEFRKIMNMGRNSKLWFFITVEGVQYLGQAVYLFSGWRISVFNNKMNKDSMSPILKFNAVDRSSLEEMMYSTYIELASNPEINQNDEQD